jgi:hypothetical protein
MDILGAERKTHATLSYLPVMVHSGLTLKLLLWSKKKRIVRCLATWVVVIRAFDSKLIPLAERYEKVHYQEPQPAVWTAELNIVDRENWRRRAFRKK